MARYVDGFFWLFRRERLKPIAAFRALRAESGRSMARWIMSRCVGDDLNTKMGVPFPRVAQAKAGETVVFSWILYKSRAHRDRVNAKVMKDPRMAKMMDPKAMPFDMKRMAFGGFKVVVDL